MSVTVSSSVVVVSNIENGNVAVKTSQISADSRVVDPSRDSCDVGSDSLEGGESVNISFSNSTYDKTRSIVPVPGGSTNPFACDDCGYASDSEESSQPRVSQKYDDSTDTFEEFDNSIRRSQPLPSATASSSKGKVDPTDSGLESSKDLATQKAPVATRKASPQVNGVRNGRQPLRQGKSDTTSSASRRVGLKRHDSNTHSSDEDSDEQEEKGGNDGSKSLVSERTEFFGLSPRQTFYYKPDKDGDTQLLLLIYDRRCFDEIKTVVDLAPNWQFLCIRNRDYGHTALHAAVYVNRHDIVKLLVFRGANVRSVDNRGDTPLSIAVRNGFWPIIEFLTTTITRKTYNEHCVKQLYDVPWQKMPQNLNQRTSMGQVILQQVFAGHIEDELMAKKIAERLIAVGANVNLTNRVAGKDRMRSALHYAAEFGWIQMVAMLVSKGADITIEQEEQSMTAYHLALTQRRWPVVKFLEQLGGHRSVQPRSILYKKGDQTLEEIEATSYPEFDEVEFTHGREYYVDDEIDERRFQIVKPDEVVKLDPPISNEETRVGLKSDKNNLFRNDYDLNLGFEVLILTDPNSATN